MWIRFTCSKCGKHFKVDERSAGKKGRCPCGNNIHIPEGKQTLGTVPTNEPLETKLEHGEVFSREIRSKVLACIGSAILSLILTIYSVYSYWNAITVGAVIQFLFGWGLFYWTSRPSMRKKRKKNTINGTTHHAGSPRESDAKIASRLPNNDTMKEIYPRHRSLKKVGLVVCGVVILLGIVLNAIYFSSSGNESMDNHVAGKKVRHEVVEENASSPRYEIKPDAPKDLWQKIKSIPQLKMEQPFAQISYSQIQRKCERVLKNSPDSTEVRKIWEQVRFFEKCSWCRGLGSGTCKQCNGSGIQNVPNGFKEESLPIFTHADHKTMAGFSYKGDSYRPGGSLQECYVVWFSLYGVPILSPGPLPDGLLEQVKYIRPKAASLYKCRNCGYYDMPILVEPFFPNSILMGEFRAGRLKISYPKTYEWTGRTGTKIFLRLQQEPDGPLNINMHSNPNFAFMKPLKTCPNCGHSEYIHKLPLTREVECDKCGGKGKVDSCTVCQGSGLERLSEERKLRTSVLLENHITFEGIRIDFIGKTCTSTTIPKRHTHGSIHLYPGKYRMLLNWGYIPNVHGIEATPSFAVSEEVEVKHHATYISKPVFILSLQGQGNTKLTKITRQEFDNIKNLTKTPVFD